MSGLGVVYIRGPGILEQMHADAFKPGGFFDQVARSGVLECMHADASKPGGFFDQVSKSGVLERMHADASKPGGFFERAAPVVERMHKQASSRQKVKGVKKDGTQDKRCSPHTLKAAAIKFGETVTDDKFHQPGALGKRYS